MLRRGFLLAGLLALGACAGRKGPAVTPADDASGSSKPAFVEVTNGFAQPVEVQVIGAGGSRRLGLVYPGGTSRFVLPPAVTLTGTVQLTASVGANPTQRYRSDPILVSPGDIIEMRIASQLFGTTVQIRE